jgi:tetratricopeptide (TPR) repeat protein
VTDQDFSRRPRSTPRIWVGVPPRNKNFTGRADVLAQLRSRTAANNTAVLLSKESLPRAVQGLGGVGKTAVAIEYAYKYGHEYDLVCWIRADQTLLVRSALAALAPDLGLDPPSASGIDQATAGVLDALRRGEPYDRWLLIFDNADRPDDLLPFVPTGDGDVLITSRNHEWAPLVDTMALDVFERAESIQFLLKRAPKGLTSENANRLADGLGDLPLALVQAAAVIYEGGMAVDEYLRQLHDRIARILELGISPEYPTSMTAAWQISVHKLRQSSPAALELLRCCAFFGPEPIPTDVFKLGSQQSRTGVGAVIADPIDLSSAISTLGRYALVKKDGPYITVHRLVQGLLRADLDPAEQNNYRQDAHSILAAGAPGNPSDEKTWLQYGDLVGHVGSAATDLAHCEVADHRRFALDVVRYLYVSGDFTSCRLFAERFIEHWTAISGPDDPYVLDANRHLGNALRELGLAAEAYKVIERTLRSAERVLEQGNPLTLHLRNAFGADLRARGDFTEALILDEETRALHEEVFGPTDPQTLRVINNLALDYGLNSNYVKARDLHKIVYVLQRDAKPNVSTTELLNALTGLARAVRLSGNYGEARDLGEQAQTYGPDLGLDHYLKLRAATDLSIAMRRIPPDYDDALDLVTDTLERCRLRRGEQHPDTLAAAISLSNLQRTIGQIPAALELANATTAMYPGVYGAEHPYNYGCQGNLALLLRRAGEPSDARQLNEAALAGLDKALTRDHLFPLVVAVNLASDLAELGHPPQARSLGSDTLARSTRLLGKDHPLTLACAANLALDLRATGAGDEAEALAADTRERCARTLRADDPLAEALVTHERAEVDFDPPPI